MSEGAVITRMNARGTGTDGISVSVTTSATTTPAISFSEFAGGTLYIPTGSSITSLTFHASPHVGGTFYPAYDDSSMSSPAAIVLTVAANRCYPIPSSLFGSGAFKMVSDAAGTVYLSMKG